MSLAPAEGVDPDQHYQLARERMDLDPAADARAAQRLCELLLEAPGDPIDPATLIPRFKGRPCVVMAPGPRALAMARSVEPGTPLIVAGSAVEQALMHEMGPWLVVTDLDGSAPAHRGLSARQVPMAVHAHGDNADLVEDLVPQLEGPLFGTCQTEPPSDPVPLHRLGGFTDGDRACYLAAALGCTEILLAGWDLDGEPVGGDGPEAKRVKLEIARELLDLLDVPMGKTEGP